MLPPPPLTCLIAEWDRSCPHATCPNYIAPVAGDYRRSRSLCMRAVVDVVNLLGQTGVRDIAYLTGESYQDVRKLLASGMGKMRRHLEVA